jgi:hypothetical protein
LAIKVIEIIRFYNQLSCVTMKTKMEMGEAGTLLAYPPELPLQKK